MIQLSSKPLSTQAADGLKNLQNNVDGKAIYIEQVAEAIRLWGNKPNTTFSAVKKALIDLTISVQTCNYCENNEATDIEHIYPKSHFPSRCFDWNNYILACGKCNTHEKSDDFAIFDPTDSNNLVELKRYKPEERIQPTTDDGALISPRTEDPMTYLWLSLEPIGQRLIFVPKEIDKTTRHYVRADYTINLLNLNRDQLAIARFQAANYFISRLKLYAHVKSATNFDELEAATDDFKPINTAISFIDEQQNILNSIKTDILHYPHPTVWAELKRQRDKLPKTNALFQSVPEALTW